MSTVHLPPTKTAVGSGTTPVGQGDAGPIGKTPAPETLGTPPTQQPDLDAARTHERVLHGTNRPAEIKDLQQALLGQTGGPAKETVATTKAGLAGAIGVLQGLEPQPLSEASKLEGWVTNVGSGIWKGLQRAVGMRMTPQASPEEPGRLGMVRFAAEVMRHRRNPVHFFEWLHGELGQSVEVKFPTGNTFLFDSHPEVMRTALLSTDRMTDVRAGKTSAFEKPPLQGRGLAYLVGAKNVFLGAGQHWAEVHKPVAQVLSPRQVHTDAFLNTMGEAVDEAVARLHTAIAQAPDGTVEVDMAQTMQGLTLDILLRTLFRKKVTPDEMGELQGAFKTVMDWLAVETLNPMSTSISTLGGLVDGANELGEAYQVLHRFADRLIEERRASGEPGNDALGALLTAVGGVSGQPLSDERIRNEVLTLVLAGHETTATLLSWAVGHLARDPQRQRTLQTEIDRAVGNGRPTVTDLVKDTPYLEGVVHETLRLYSPAYFLVRRATEDVELEVDGQKRSIAEGTILVMSAFHAHRDPERWDRTGAPANEWFPERWDKDRRRQLREAGDTKTHEMNPFGGGSRKCLGAAMSQLEAQLILARFAQEFEMHASHDMGISSDISVHPTDARVTLKRRQATARQAS